MSWICRWPRRPSDQQTSASTRLPVQHCVSYAASQIRRLEAAGDFPERIRLGNNRVGWLFRDILDWMQAKIDARPVGPLSPKVTIDTSDRFIRSKEVRALVLYHPEHLRRLENQD